MYKLCMCDYLKLSSVENISLACSTCMVILNKSFSPLPPPPLSHTHTHTHTHTNSYMFTRTCTCPQGLLDLEGSLASVLVHLVKRDQAATNMLDTFTDAQDAMNNIKEKLHEMMRSKENFNEDSYAEVSNFRDIYL